MNQLKTEKRVAIVRCLADGVSIRGTCRITGAAKNTVVKLLVELGQVCEAFHDRAVRGLRCHRIQCDEIWNFCYAKEENVPDELRGTFGYGDVWTWVALDAETKLTLSWTVGRRDAAFAEQFMLDVAGRVLNRVQLTTDGLRAYLDAVENAFGFEVDFTQLVKMYGDTKEPTSEGRYSPPKWNGSKKTPVLGLPDRAHISTSYIERQNLTMRMGMRRFTRLTNGFSKKLFNLECAVALHFVHYNFCRKHQTLGATPAVAAGLADHVWSIEELVGLLDSN
ncbi:MAG: IS1 family transposase [Phycisphaerales bacterium]|nr:IS1 family transposase [Phycisphaerales bacterium]